MAGFETSKFGNGVLVGSGGNVVQNVHNYFEARDSGETVGVFKTEGGENHLTFNLTGKQIGRLGTDEILVPPVLTAGFVVTAVYARVTEAFALGGTTPTITIGTEGSSATNGFSLTEAQAEAVGMYNITSSLTGTWAAPINADTTVGIALGGTSPTITTAGKVDIIVKYTKP